MPNQPRIFKLPNLLNISSLADFQNSTKEDYQITAILDVDDIITSAAIAKGNTIISAATTNLIITNEDITFSVNGTTYTWSANTPVTDILNNITTFFSDGGENRCKYIYSDRYELERQTTDSVTYINSYLAVDTTTGDAVGDFNRLLMLGDNWGWIGNYRFGSYNPGPDFNPNQGYWNAIYQTSLRGFPFQAFFSNNTATGLVFEGTDYSHDKRLAFEMNRTYMGLGSDQILIDGTNSIQFDALDGHAFFKTTKNGTLYNSAISCYVDDTEQYLTQEGFTVNTLGFSRNIIQDPESTSVIPWSVVRGNTFKTGYSQELNSSILPDTMYAATFTCIGLGADSTTLGTKDNLEMMQWGRGYLGVGDMSFADNDYYHNYFNWYYPHSGDFAQGKIFAYGSGKVPTFYAKDPSGLGTEYRLFELVEPRSSGYANGAVELYEPIAFKSNSAPGEYYGFIDPSISSILLGQYSRPVTYSGAKPTYVFSNSNSFDAVNFTHSMFNGSNISSYKDGNQLTWNTFAAGTNIAFFYDLLESVNTYRVAIGKDLASYDLNTILIGDGLITHDAESVNPDEHELDIVLGRNNSKFTQHLKDAIVVIGNGTASNDRYNSVEIYKDKSIAINDKVYLDGGYVIYDGVSDERSFQERVTRVSIPNLYQASTATSTVIIPIHSGYSIYDIRAEAIKIVGTSANERQFPFVKAIDITYDGDTIVDGEGNVTYEITWPAVDNDYTNVMALVWYRKSKNNFI